MKCHDSSKNASLSLGMCPLFSKGTDYALIFTLITISKKRLYYEELGFHLRSFCKTLCLFANEACECQVHFITNK